MQHTLLYISLPLFCTTTTWHFQKLPSYTFHVGTFVRVLVHFFHCRSFSLCIGGPLAYRSYELFMLFFQPRKICLLCFLSLALDLCRSFSRWASVACRLLSLFLCLSLALYFKFVDMTINLGLILWTTRIQKQLPLSVFVFIDSVVFSALQDAVDYAISCQITSSCIWVAIPADWVILHWYAGGADGRALGHVITKFSRMCRFT